MLFAGKGCPAHSLSCLLLPRVITSGSWAAGFYRLSARPVWVDLHHALLISCVWASLNGCLQSECSTASGIRLTSRRLKSDMLFVLFVSQQKRIPLSNSLACVFCNSRALLSCISHQWLADNLNAESLWALVSMAASVSHLLGLPLFFSVIMTIYRPFLLWVQMPLCCVPVMMRPKRAA